MLAKRLCFPVDFERLLKKHLPETEHDMILYHIDRFKSYKFDLITWIFSFSDSSIRDFWIEVNEKIVLDLLESR